MFYRFFEARCRTSLPLHTLSGYSHLQEEMRMNTTQIQTTANTQPAYRKVIGKTTYVVRVHFNEDAKETMADKIKRMLREEVRNM